MACEKERCASCPVLYLKRMCDKEIDMHWNHRHCAPLQYTAHERIRRHRFSMNQRDTQKTIDVHRFSVTGQKHKNHTCLHNFKLPHLTKLSAVLHNPTRV